MSVKYTDNTKKFTADVKAKIPIALRLILDAVDEKASPHTPKDLGDLKKNKLKQVLGMHATIVWKQQYAAIQEEKQFSNYTTAGTGPHYAENAVKEVVAHSAQYFKKAGL
jgi:hypothetical protein